MFRNSVYLYQQLSRSIHLVNFKTLPTTVPELRSTDFGIKTAASEDVPLSAIDLNIRVIRSVMAVVRESPTFVVANARLAPTLFPIDKAAATVTISGTV